MRDYLQGNLRLDATVAPDGDMVAGEFVLRPSDIRFFGPDRRPANSSASLAMRLILWKEGFRFDEPYPERMAFSIVREE